MSVCLLKSYLLTDRAGPWSTDVGQNVTTSVSLIPQYGVVDFVVYSESSFFPDF